MGAQVFTHLLDKAFSDIKFEYVYNYLDDLVIYSVNIEEHLKHLHEVFLCLKAAGLNVKLSKVQFDTSQLSFLGHLISPEGVHLALLKTQSICEFPMPRKVKDIAHFLGMVNFFHNFILNFAQVAAPMKALCKNGVRF